MSSGRRVEFVPPEFADRQGVDWREYRIALSAARLPATRVAGVPEEMPRRVAWPLKDRSTTPCVYGRLADRILYARTGAATCSLALDRSTGEATLSGANFVRVTEEGEIPLVPWDELRMGVTCWADEDVRLADGAAGPRPLALEARSVSLPPGRAEPGRGRRARPLSQAGIVPGEVEVLDLLGRVRRVLTAGDAAKGDRA